MSANVVYALEAAAQSESMINTLSFCNTDTNTKERLYALKCGSFIQNKQIQVSIHGRITSSALNNEQVRHL